MTDQHDHEAEIARRIFDVVLRPVEPQVALAAGMVHVGDYTRQTKTGGKQHVHAYERREEFAADPHPYELNPDRFMNEAPEVDDVDFGRALAFAKKDGPRIQAGHVDVRVGDEALQDLAFGSGKILAFGDLPHPETSGKGSSYYGEREAYETGTLGVPATANPVSGYMSVEGMKQDDPAEYGRYNVILKNRVKGRTTITLGDSLNRQANGMWLNTMLDGTDPEIGTRFVQAAGDDESIFFDQSMDPLEYLGDYSYIEAQIHGGVSIGDIDTFTLPTKPPAWPIVESPRTDEQNQQMIKAATALQAKGVHVVWEDGTEFVPEKEKSLAAGRVGGSHLSVGLTAEGRHSGEGDRFTGTHRHRPVQPAGPPVAGTAVPGAVPERALTPDDAEQ